MPDVVYVWEQTPTDWFKSVRPVSLQKTQDRVQVEVLPFTCPKRQLLGTQFFYQAALSSTSRSEDVRILKAACPTVSLSGDLRSGVLVFDGSRIIASYILPGEFTRNERRIAVHPDYRGQGLATRLISQWQREVPSIVRLSPQPVNVAGMRTFLAANKMTLQWALDQGKGVPQQVRDCWAQGVEEAAILEELRLIEGSQGSPRLTARRR